MESVWCGLCLARNVYRRPVQVTFRRFAASMTQEFTDNKNKFYRVVLTGGEYCKTVERSAIVFSSLAV